jgi:hypothetical protein
MAARVTKIRHDEETRAKIQAAQIINRFQACVNGEVELDAQQVSCGKALLNKVLPDLSSVSMDGEMKHSADDSLAKLFAEIAANGKRVHD